MIWTALLFGVAGEEFYTTLIYSDFGVKNRPFFTPLFIYNNVV